MNKIAVFGASGMTGTCVVKAALEKDKAVQALLRDPSKLSEEYRDKINVIKGDVLYLEEVKRTLEGQDGVIVVLGTRKDLSPTTSMSEGLKNILIGMKELNISVVSVCLSAFLFYEPEKVPAIFHEITAEHRRMLNVLKDSDLEWIAVNPPHIADELPTGYITKHDEMIGRKVISKYDLGQFFVDSLTMTEHYKKVIGVSSNTQ